MNITNNFEAMESINTNHKVLASLKIVLERGFMDVVPIGQTSDLAVLVDEEGLEGDHFFMFTFPTVHAARRVLTAVKTGTLETLIRGAERAKAAFPQELWEAYAWWISEDEY